MDLRTALLQGQKLLEDADVTAPRLTAEVLLAYAVGRDRSWLFAHSDEELREVWWIHYGRYLHQRIGGMPTQYITGVQEFYGREFRVTRDVLIPRPETEHVIEAALARAADARMILDIGTGSGAIAVTLALETKARVFATDLSEPAARVASRNAQRLGAAVNFVVGDLGTAFGDSKFDMVISNPPYVPLEDRATLQREVRDHEPELALYGGPDGFEIYRRLVPEARRLLRPGGWLIMELAFNVEARARQLVEDWTEVAVARDLAGLPRVLSARNS